MAEAEDVIVDAARHVTARVLDLWQRRRDGASTTDGADLAALKARLALLVEAWAGAPLPIHAAAAHPPRTVLARLFRRRARPRSAHPLPSTDGHAIYLPPAFACGSQAASIDFYRVTALHQALRCVRGTAAAYARAGSALVEDLLLIAEMAAIDRTMARDMPGLRDALHRVRALTLAARPAPGSLRGVASAVESLYRAALRGDFSGIPWHPGAEASLEWAVHEAQRLARAAGEPYCGLPPDESLGEVLPADAAPTAFAGARESTASPGPARSAALKRRPRAREAKPDEDDASAGLIMVQSSPPSEHAEDPMGLRRPVDRDEDLDLDGAAESLGDLEEARLVSTPGTPRAILASEAPPGARSLLPPPCEPAAAGAVLAYPEWDWTREAYLHGAVHLRESVAQEGSQAWVERTLERHRVTLARIRRRFEALRARRSIEHRRPDGDEIDLDAFVAAIADRRARLPREDRLYQAARPARLDVALLVLIDASGSTDAWAGENLRIIDVEKEALLVLASAMEALGLESAIHAFSGHGPHDVRMRWLKRFEDPYSAGVQRRIAGLEPEAFTRLGAVLRHATALLARRARRHRLLLLLSDGKPNDCDRYEGRHGVEDTRQALAEARLQGIAPFCVTIDRHAGAHLPFVFGPNHYTVVREPNQLTGALVEWLRVAAIAGR